MADNRTAQLLAASFKGVAFSVFNESSAEVGRKIILHEYANSSERFVEDQGQIPDKFTVRGFVHGPDYKSRANRLEKALNEKGPGILSLPNSGIREVYAGAYTKDADQKRVGEVNFTMAFYAGKPAPGPSVSQIGIEDLYQTSDQARVVLEEVFSDIYPVPNTSSNAIAAIGDLNNIISAIAETVKTTLPVDDLERVLRIQDGVKLNAAKLVRAPETLAGQIFAGKPQLTGLWQQISLGYSQSSAVGKEAQPLSLLTNLGGGLTLTLNEINRAVPVTTDKVEIPLWPATTAQRIARNNSRNTLCQANRVASLIGVYEDIANKSYKTDEEIIATRQNVEEIHERIMRVETSDYDLFQSKPDVRESVENVRLASLDILGQKEQESYEIAIDKTGVPTSALVRSYLLYAEDFTNTKQLTDRAEEIALLNIEQPSSALNKEFKIFQV